VGREVSQNRDLSKNDAGGQQADWWVTARQCEAERMLAHAITARVRVERYS